jgi:DNA-binding LacI/PurR family transcriptional regulator
MEGYKQGLAGAGIAFDRELLYEGEFTYESGKKAATVLMGQPHPPTAIFGSNDQEALGCLFQLRTSGYHVPEQVSVAGFDDIETTQYVYPALTTVHVPMQKIGEMGVQQMIKALSQAEPVEQTHTMPHQLVIRASTAPPQGR